MKVYLVTQRQYSEGNYGDLFRCPDKLIGIFSSLSEAEEIKTSIKTELFKASFGEAKELVDIREIELDKTNY